MEIISDIKKKLSEVGLKSTTPRIVVLDALIKSKDHPTAEEIFERVKNSHPSISLGSVYRVLEVLVQAGLIRRVSVKYGSKRYDADLRPHGHIYCATTNYIQDFYDEELNGLINEFFKRKKFKNFKIKDIKLQVNGERINTSSEVTIS
ncbi:MAG: hypothetical protein Tsb0034_26170 [Ekhidna sp.]